MSPGVLSGRPCGRKPYRFLPILMARIEGVEKSFNAQLMGSRGVRAGEGGPLWTRVVENLTKWRPVPAHNIQLEH